MVEDNPGDVRLAREAFKDHRITNITHMNVVSDGEEALKYLHKEGEYSDAVSPDLILLDLNIPKISGQDVLKEIKNDPELKVIPTVILTSSTNETDILRSYKLQANCYISKPIELDNFIQVVKQIENFWVTIVKCPPKVQV